MQFLRLQSVMSTKMRHWRDAPPQSSRWVSVNQSKEKRNRTFIFLRDEVFEKKATLIARAFAESFHFKDLCQERSIS